MGSMVAGRGRSLKFALLSALNAREVFTDRRTDGRTNIVTLKRPFIRSNRAPADHISSLVKAVEEFAEEEFEKSLEEEEEE